MAKGDFGGKRNTEGFDKNPENINSTGLNRKSIASVNKELQAGGYEAASKRDIIDCYLRLINVDIGELTIMSEDEEQPAMVRIVATSIIGGKGFDIIEKVLDRGIGKADSNLNVKADVVVEKNPFEDMSVEDLLAMKKIRDKYKDK